MFRATGGGSYELTLVVADVPEMPDYRKNDYICKDIGIGRYGSAQENSRPGFQEHQFGGTLVLVERELHIRRQRGGQDQSHGCHLLSLHDQELVLLLGQILLPSRHGFILIVRNLQDEGH